MKVIPVYSQFGFDGVILMLVASDDPTVHRFQLPRRGAIQCC